MISAIIREITLLGKFFLYSKPTKNAAFESSIIKFILLSGYEVSIGTYDAPHCSIAKMIVINSGDLSNETATICPDVKP